MWCGGKNYTDTFECPLYCFIHLVNKQFLSADQVPGTALSPKETMVNNGEQKSPCPREVYILVGGDWQ